MARIVDSSTSYSLNVRTNADSLGQLLKEAKTDYKRILVDLLLRSGISALAVWIWNRQGSFTGIASWICYAGLFIFAAYPLVHCMDTLQFYENGIMFKKKPCLFRSQQVQWLCREGVLNLLEGRYLYLGGYSKKINASYVQKPQDAFAAAYRNTGIK